MLFNSRIFVIFFLVVYGGYLALHSRLRAQNLWLLAASYLFYGYWDWRFLLLLAATTGVDFWVGLKLDSAHDPRVRRAWLWLSVGSNLAMLGFFKYFNFFAASFARLLAAAGLDPDPLTLEVVLPVGISFYTFQTLTYTIDIYRGTLRPTRDFFGFALFNSFFPQLVAGPIERAARLLPQVLAPRRITAEQVSAGLFLVLWGYFQKVVVADNVASISNAVFNDYRQYQGLDLVLGILAFSLQIYCDFSGYSDIVRGLAKLMGFELALNFKLPYFATDPSDFWQRWHISLSTWLRDYLYIPLGGNRHGHWLTCRNLLLTMLLGGLWHGAAWNYVFWGGYHGLLLVAYRVGGRLIRTPGKTAVHPLLPVLALRIATMFVLTTIGWVIFRSHSLEQALSMLSRVGLSTTPVSAGWAEDLLFFSLPVVAVQIWQQWSGDLLVLTKTPLLVRAPLYSMLVVWLSLFSVRVPQEFFYFQF